MEQGDRTRLHKVKEGVHQEQDTSHKLRSLWAGPYRVMNLITMALADIKPVYYHGE